MEINKIYCGDALELLKTFPDNFVDCCITSPPYWGLRDYGVKGQLGNEPEFETFIENLCNIFIEVKRVLKDTGTCFVNLGDTYAGSGGWDNWNEEWQPSKQTKHKSVNLEYSKFRNASVPNKCLCMIPERFAIKMIDKGWILRNKIIWRKPNQMPSSASDRFTVDFEDIFFFVQEQKYYFEQQFEPYTELLNRWGGTVLETNGNSEWDKGPGQIIYRNRNMRLNEEGRNMRTVWDINTETNKDEHFATYPELLVKRMIKAGCPEKICKCCGKPMVRKNKF